MVQYLYAGDMPENAVTHLRHFIGITPERYKITQPRKAEGILIPESEINCAQFIAELGMEARDFHEYETTDDPQVRLLTSPKVKQPPPRKYGVSYTGNSRKTADLLQKLAQEYKTDIYTISRARRCFYRQECNCDIDDPLEEDEDEDLVIHFNCARRTVHGLYRLDRVYEYELTAGDSFSDNVRWAIHASGGTPVTDTNGAILAEVADGEIYLLFNIDYIDVDTRFQYINWTHANVVLTQILQQAIPIALKQKQENDVTPRYLRDVANRTALYAAQIDQTLERFVKIDDRRSANRIAELEAEIRRLTDYAADFAKEAIKKSRQAGEQQRMLNALRDNPEDVTAKRQRELANVLAMPDVIGMVVDENETIHVYTGLIYITYEGRRYRVGSFDIRVNFPIASLTIVNMTGKRDGRHHPHVFEDGRVCLGQIQEYVTMMLQHERFEELITIMVQFLKQFKYEDRRYSVTEWPVAEPGEGEDQNAPVLADARA